MTDPATSTPRVGKAARNEARKAIATTANALSITMVVTIWLQPMLSSRPLGFAGPLAGLTFIVLQGLAHYVLRMVRTSDGSPRLHVLVGPRGHGAHAGGLLGRRQVLRPLTPLPFP